MDIIERKRSQFEHQNGSFGRKVGVKTSTKASIGEMLHDSSWSAIRPSVSTRYTVEPDQPETDIGTQQPINVMKKIPPHDLPDSFHYVRLPLPPAIRSPSLPSFLLCLVLLFLYHWTSEDPLHSSSLPLHCHPLPLPQQQSSS